MPCGGIYPIKGTWVEALEQNIKEQNEKYKAVPATIPVIAIDIETTGKDGRGEIPKVTVENIQQFEPMKDCWHCGEAIPEADHFCDEWDCYLHGKCVKPFLETDEGKIVLSHKHLVHIEIDGKLERLYEEQ